MTQQTFIAYFKDSAGKQVDFQRFGYKKLETVKKAINTLWNNSLYRALIKNAVKVEIFETEYSPAAGQEPASIITL